MALVGVALDQGQEAHGRDGDAVAADLAAPGRAQDLGRADDVVVVLEGLALALEHDPGHGPLGRLAADGEDLLHHLPGLEVAGEAQAARLAEGAGQRAADLRGHAHAVARPLQGDAHRLEQGAVRGPGTGTSRTGPPGCGGGRPPRAGPGGSRARIARRAAALRPRTSARSSRSWWTTRERTRRATGSGSPGTEAARLSGVSLRRWRTESRVQRKAILALAAATPVPAGRPRRRRLMLTLALVLASSAAPSLPQERPPLEFAADVRMIRLDVSVVDRRGRPVAGLGVRDFEVTEDGRPVEIALFEAIHEGDDATPTEDGGLVVTPRPRAGQRILLLVDTASMTYGQFVRAREGAARFITDSSREGDWVRLMNLATGEAWDGAIPDERLALAQVARGLLPEASPWSGSPAHEGIVEVPDNVRSPETGAASDSLTSGRSLVHLRADGGAARDARVAARPARRGRGPQGARALVARLPAAPGPRPAPAEGGEPGPAGRHHGLLRGRDGARRPAARARRAA